MPILSANDMNSHIYPEVQNAISRGDNGMIQAAIDAAIDEAKGYCSRFRVDQIFENVDAVPGWKYDSILTMHLKNMARWHFITVSNPDINWEDAEIRYSNALRWLREVQKGQVVPTGWPLVTEPEGADSYFHLSSNPKRKNHF